MQIVDKILTMEDVQLLNSEKNSIVVLKNTVGQSIDVIKNLSPNVRIQIIGGYDGTKKSKYNEWRIQRRTIYNSSEVCSIIAKFEEYEKDIDPTWSDLEKAVYIYKKFGESIKYKEDNGNRSRNLNAILGSGVCAGYSIVFKEAMDRLGIGCDIINEPRVHTWNAIKIDGKWYPLDLTWDANNIQNMGSDNITWFGQTRDFSKYKNHTTLGEDGVPDNCFDPQVIADALNKVTHSNKYQPIKQSNGVDAIFAQVLNMSSQGNDLNGIMAGMRQIAEFAFKAGKVYSDTAYINEFDSKFNDIFQAIKSNDQLTDEQKRVLLMSTNGMWQDVMGKINLGGIHYSLHNQIWESLKDLDLLINNKDFLEVDREFIESQLKEVYKKCTSYGTLDVVKLETMAQQIEKQVAEMRKAKEVQDTQIKDTQIKIKEPIQIIDAEPAKEFDLMKWTSHQINYYEALLNGLKESGEDVKDTETQNVISACSTALECLRSNYNEYSQSYERGM